jgi:hypothetical protein
MRLELRALLPLTLLSLSIHCGGATTDDTGQTSAAGGAGGSSGAGTAGKGGSGAASGTGGTGGAGGSGGSGGTSGAAGESGSGGAGGSSGTGGSGAAGSGTAGTSGSAGSAGGAAAGGSAGSSGATAGSAGAAGAGAASGQGGSGGSGGAGGACCSGDSCGDGGECVKGVCKALPVPGMCWSDPDCPAGTICAGGSVCPCNFDCDQGDQLGKCLAPPTGWNACTGPGQCQLAPKGCCDGCGIPLLESRDAVNSSTLDQHYAEVCPVPEPCPKCASKQNPDLAAFCEQPSCAVIEVSKHPVSACASDADCTLRFAECCDCSGAPEQLIATNQKGYYEYEQQVCPGGGGCPSDCAPQHPAGYVASCDVSTGHCRVAEQSAAICPPQAPEAGTLCKVAGDCEYGSDVRVSCRAHASCVGGAWQVTAAKCSAIPGPGESGCPASVDVPGGACPASGGACDMGVGAVCECGQCLGGPCLPDPPATWACAQPPPAPCPSIAPNTGHACALPPGTTCQYGINCAQTSFRRICGGDGVWVDDGVICPL